jgi:hypothetical protein
MGLSRSPTKNIVINTIGYPYRTLRSGVKI